MTAEELIREVEAAGGSLSLRGDRIHYKLPASATAILDKLRAHREEVLTELRRCHRAIPAGAILLAPRYDGGGKPLASVPKCWCCKTPYQLDRLQESKGKTYAWLEPGCGCLNRPQALACCGFCVEHCRCEKPARRAPELEPEPEQAQPAVCWHCAGTSCCDCATCWHADPGRDRKAGECAVCKARMNSNAAQKTSQSDFRTPRGDGSAR